MSNKIDKFINNLFSLEKGIYKENGVEIRVFPEEKLNIHKNAFN